MGLLLNNWEVGGTPETNRNVYAQNLMAQIADQPVNSLIAKEIPDFILHFLNYLHLCDTMYIYINVYMCFIIK